MNGDKSKPNPKMDAFVKELNELLDRYQYQIVPIVEYTKRGVLPTVSIVDVLPKPKTTEETKPEQEMPKVQVAEAENKPENPKLPN